MAEMTTDLTMGEFDGGATASVGENLAGGGTVRNLVPEENDLMEGTHLNRDVAQQMLAGLSGVQSEIEDGGVAATKAQRAFIAGGIAALENLLSVGDVR